MEDLAIRIRLEELITEREAMIAENKQREHLGQSMAYGEDCFFVLKGRMEAIRSMVKP